MRKITAILLAMALLMTIPAAVAETENLKQIIFCLDWTPNTNHTGVYVADALGYYRDEGLEVQIVQPPENGAVLMCASNQAQFAVDAQDTMAASLDLEEPLPITAVAAILQHNTSGILTRAEDGITNAKGLEGRIYSTWDSPIELAMLRYCVEKEGGDFSKVKLIPNNITDEPAALGTHQTDAVWVFYGWSGINANVNIHYVIPTSSSFAIYPLVGFNYGNYDSENFFGANVGLGAQYQIKERLHFFTEERIQIIKDFNQSVTFLGLKYTF